MKQVVESADYGQENPDKGVPEFSTVKGGRAKTADVNKAMARFLEESQDSDKRDGKSE